MRSVELAGWPSPVSALGFGCASLGSRVSRKAGAAAIESALAAGITWFDVAPSYGDGEAESILGDALGGAKVAILTKVGLSSRPASGVTKVVRRVVRPIISAVPSLRSLVKPLRAGAIGRVALSAETIRASLNRSLERLKVDRVAVLALHDPSDDDVRSDEVLRALDDVKRQGLAVRIGIAGAYANFAAAHESNRQIDVAQVAADEGAGRIAPLNARGVFTVTHSVFAGGSSLRDCFAANPAGVVLASSFRAEHLKANVAAANESRAL
jgi:aryl-alcohol dehydrogenase-like predicted oxidoreductase